MSYISQTGSAGVWSYYDPFRAGRSAQAARSAVPAESAQGPTAAEVRTRLISSATSLRNAFNFLAQNLRRITMPRLEGAPGTKALARATFVPPSMFSILQTTREINGTPSAIRTSTSPLSLDTLSPEQQSILESLAAIGLDVTSPERRTVLQSSNPLGLDTATPERASRIQSTAEANTTPTSYGVVQATFGSSSSLGNLSGTYRGTGAAANATALTLTVSSLLRNINSIPNLVSVNVRDQNGTNLGTYQASVRAGDQLSLGGEIGLSIAFTEGALQNGSSTTFAVSNTTPTDLDPNAIFNASNINNRPRFENGAQVTAGSFSVNGTSVQVFANDSINSVLQRIYSTVSGVVASYQNDRVVIESSTASEDNILLANDSSGFFTALKLNGAVTTRGKVRDDLQVFSKTSQFASVTSGSFRVNGQSISVDPLADSIQSIATKINSAGAGVTAAYDPSTDRFVLTSNDPSEDAIVFDNDTTGFLNLATLDTNNSVLGNIRDDRQVLSQVSAFSGVTSGTFRVNGTEISVNTGTDTLETIVARINASVPGINLSYDSSQDKLVFTTTSNSEDDILLTHDATGFLAATQLESAATARGNIRDDEQTLNKVAAFTSVVSGSFELNGSTISVDPATDSLNTILARINASAAGVTATYDPAQNRVTLDPGTNALVLGNDTSGFLEAIEMETGASATRVNEHAAFNGSGLEAPHFESGVAVSAGSFMLNDTQITVNADDSIQDVLDKITASSAGITASFNAATETVTLRAKTPGSQPISLDQDTSGFLAAVKLDGTATFDPGASASEMLLRESTPGATSGTILLNDQSVSVDPDTDSLATLAQKLDALEGVQAFLDEATGAFTLRSETEGGSLLLSDSSGVLNALGIRDGSYTGEAPTFRTVHSKNSKFQVLNKDKVLDRLAEGFASLNQALETVQNATSLTLSFRDDVQDAVRDSFGAIPAARNKGLLIVNQSNKPFAVNIERSLLSNALRQDGKILEELYKGRNNLPDALENLAADAQTNFLVTPAAAVAVTPTPAAAVAAEFAGDFYKIGSASQLFLIDSITIPATEFLTPPEPSPVVETDEPNSSGDMEGSRNFSRAVG